jgi:hypothetical protein
MSIRTSIILVISLVMVAGYVFFIQIRDSDEDPEGPPFFYNLDEMDMTRVAVTTPAGEAVFFLGGDNRWHLDDPNGLPVGRDRWGGVTLLLSGPKSRRLLDEQPTDLAPYGLDSPQVRIDVDLKDGRTLPVLLGFPTPDGVGVYAQVEGFPQVFTIVAGWGELMVSLITDPPYPEWYYGVNTALLTGIGLETQDVSINIKKGSTGWHFDDDELTPVDEVQLPSILASLEQPSRQALVQYGPVNLAQYGLDEPSLSLFLRTESIQPGNIRASFESLYIIGHITDDGTAYYAQTETEELLQDVFSVDADWVEALQAIAANPPYVGEVAQGS